MAIRNVADCDRWVHIQGAMNPADIPARFSDVKDFDRWFQSPVSLFWIEFKFEGFDATEKLELVEDVASIEAKVKKSGKGKGKSSMASCVITQVVNATMIEHVNFWNVYKQTLSKNSSENTFNTIIKITKCSSLNKVIVKLLANPLSFINNLKSSAKKKGLCKEDILQVNEYKELLKLWIKCEQGFLNWEDNHSKLNVSLWRKFLCLKGQFANSLICYDERHLMLLRKGSIRYFTTLIVCDSHHKVLRHGTETTLNHIRSKFWITKGRKPVKVSKKMCNM